MPRKTTDDFIKKHKVNHTITPTTKRPGKQQKAQAANVDHRLLIIP